MVSGYKAPLKGIKLLVAKHDPLELKSLKMPLPD